MSDTEIARAKRLSGSRWRDMRLWIGVLLVAGSALAGSWALRSADDYTLVWVVNRDAAAGEVLTADDLEAQQIRFARDADAAPYFLADDELPADLTLTSDVASGQLLARTDLGSASTDGVAQLPLAVDPHQLPPDVRPGSVVDVWVATESATEQVFDDVSVISVGASGGEFDPSAPRQVVIALPDDNGVDLALTLAETGTVTVVLQAS